MLSPISTLMFLYELTPGVVEQHSIGLKTVSEPIPRPRGSSFDDLEGFLVPSIGGQPSGSPACHKTVKGCLHQPTLKDPLHCFFENGKLHPPGILSIRQITIVAVDIAERTGLNDEEAQGKRPNLFPLIEVRFVPLTLFFFR